MDGGKQLKIGDKAELLIGRRWYKCTVESITDIAHYSGQSIRMFTCGMRDGHTICCGRNSIRPNGDKR